MAKGTTVNNRKVAVRAKRGSGPWTSIKIKTAKYNRIHDLCEYTQQSVAFYVDEALDYYFGSRFPIWEQAFENVKKK